MKSHSTCCRGPSIAFSRIWTSWNYLTTISEALILASWHHHESLNIMSILRCAGKASTFVCSVLGNPSIGVDGQSTWALGTQDMEIFGKFFKWEGFISTSLGDVFLFGWHPRGGILSSAFFLYKKTLSEMQHEFRSWQNKSPPPPFLLCSFSGQCKIAFHFLYMFFFGGRGTCFVFFRCWLQWLYDSGSIKIVIPKPEIFISPKSWRKVTSSILNAGKVILHPLKMESSLDFWKAFGLHELNKKTSKAWAHVPAPVARYWRVLGGFG